MSEPNTPPRGRRAALASLGGLLALGGCGFRPLYGPAEREGTPQVNAALASIRVLPIPERRGQILRQELERRFAANGTAEARYNLTAFPLVAAELQGYRRDGSPSRARYTYTVPFSLSTMAVPPVTVAAGTVVAFDAFNLPDSQFFAALQSANAADRRLIEQVARDIAERLAIALRDRPVA